MCGHLGLPHLGSSHFFRITCAPCGVALGRGGRAEGRGRGRLWMRQLVCSGGDLALARQLAQQLATSLMSMLSLFRCTCSHIRKRIPALQFRLETLIASCHDSADNPPLPAGQARGSHVCARLLNVNVSGPAGPPALDDGQRVHSLSLHQLPVTSGRRMRLHQGGQAAGLAALFGWHWQLRVLWLPHAPGDMGSTRLEHGMLDCRPGPRLTA